MGHLIDFVLPDSLIGALSHLEVQKEPVAHCMFGPESFVMSNSGPVIAKQFSSLVLVLYLGTLT